jgi:hypothetical protein
MTSTPPKDEMMNVGAYIEEGKQETADDDAFRRYGDLVVIAMSIRRMGGTYAEIGEAIGVSRERASEMVHRYERDVKFMRGRDGTA